MRQWIARNLFRNAALALLALLLAFAVDARAVTIAWSPVGNPGNANDTVDGDLFTTGIQRFGAVAYNYSIGTYDITNRQYVEFLNAKDPTGTNTLALYNVNFSDLHGGITFNSTFTDGSKYGVVPGRGDRPINSVLFYEALRFANWLNNGQGDGDTETGAYTLGELGPGAVPITLPCAGIDPFISVVSRPGRRTATGVV